MKVFPGSGEAMSFGNQSAALGQGTGKRLSPAALFAITWLFLPNLMFVPLWITGGPPRPLAIMLYLVVGLSVRFLPLAGTAFLLLATILFDVMTTLSGIFNLSPVSLLYALKFLPNLDLFASVQYVLMIFGLTVVFVAVLWIVAKARKPLVKATILPALAGAVVLIVGEHQINAAPALYFGRLVSADAPFDSAMTGSGMAEEIFQATDGRNVVVIMVESLARFTDPKHEKLLTAWIDNDKLKARYRIETGHTTFYGSTTAAEVRELCGRWQEYGALMDKPQADCLPARLAAAGYQTTALHGFTGNMFDRRFWYPNIGFQRSLFFEQMHRADDQICQGVFTGLCDVQVGDRVEEILRQSDGRPQFVHWLTLNTHVPVPITESNGTLACNDRGGIFNQVMVCTMAELWLQLFDRITRLALDDDLPPTDFIIVGDHAPPFWRRKDKDLFVAGQVPWVVLRDRRERRMEARTEVR